MKPPRCPNTRCPHARDGGDVPFFRHKGAYTRAGDRRVRRFQCRACGRHFSEQTFRRDYRRRRPDIDAPVARLAAAGFGIRATARLLMVDRKTIARRLRERAPAGAPAGGA